MSIVAPTPSLPLHPAEDPQRAAKLTEATQQFESMLLRRVLSALEKTARVSQGGSSPAGASAYGSMVVEALSDAIAQAGGLGLSQDMARQVGAAVAISPSASHSLGSKSGTPLKSDAALPFSSVRATPTESNPVLVNRRK
ncbi:MAG TPA: hypothetical protein PKA88_23870 [Polyangiaceae bacterium]|nr:hypothetical protein [Polyangiaceae bacterium]HMR77230.1 hypothetical protein [Polyangiaceae bacterium]